MCRHAINLLSERINLTETALSIVFRTIDDTPDLALKAF